MGVRTSDARRLSVALPVATRRLPRGSQRRGRRNQVAESVFAYPGTVLRRSRRKSSACPGDDLLDDLRFGIGVVLGVLPLAFGELALGGRVEVPIRRIRSQPVSEPEHALDLRGAVGEDVQVDVGIGA